MEIKATDVKALRDATGAGMMDAKKALQDADGDIDAAKKLLRERGMASAAKLSERMADEGVVESYLHQPDPTLPPKVGVETSPLVSTPALTPVSAMPPLR